MGSIKDKYAALLPDITSTQTDLLESYLDLLLDYNTRFNLTSITSREDAVVKHIADSLSASSFIKQGDTLLDIGSGGGCPGIPLKIIHPDITLTMTDSVGKKVDFLNVVISALNLKQAYAYKIRAEELARTSSRESFSVVTARAVAALPILLELASPLIKPGGRFIAYKGNINEEIIMAQNAAKTLHCHMTSKTDYLLDGQYARTLVVYEKTAAVSNTYPRPYAKIQKQPL